MKMFSKMIFLLLFLTIQAAYGDINFKETYDWEKAKTLCRGIKYFSFNLKKPRLMKISAVRVDLSTPGLRFMVTKRAEKWGEPMPDYPQLPIRTKRATCREFMKESRKDGHNMLVAVNGTPWSPFTAPWNHTYAARQGLLISDGELVSELRKGRPSFVVYKDGTYGIKAFKEGEDLSSIRHAISGFGISLKAGKCRGDKKLLAPRTGYGLCKDHRYFYIFAVDGRQKKYSMGSTIYEVGEILAYLGAYDGLNMDGGGSTTLLLWRKNKILKLNRHARGAERSVGGSLGICIDKK